MKLRKNDVLTIPNIISLFRLILIPIIVWLYCGVENYYAAVGVVVLSGLSDVVDGFIARKFNMVSDFGKVLDPIADWLTQFSLVICLLFKYKLMWVLFIAFIIRQLVMFIVGYIVVKKRDAVHSSRWYGKANTVVLYGVMLILFLFPNISLDLANLLIGICLTTIIASLVLYLIYYAMMLKDENETKN